jgi:hypothetical protein
MKHVVHPAFATVQVDAYARLRQRAGEEVSGELAGLLPWGSSWVIQRGDAEVGFHATYPKDFCNGELESAFGGTDL